MLSSQMKSFYGHIREKQPVISASALLRNPESCDDSSDTRLCNDVMIIIEMTCRS